MNLPIIDGHNDALLHYYYRTNRDKSKTFFLDRSSGHTDLPRAIEGGLAAGFMAVSCLPLSPLAHPDRYVTEEGYDFPLDPPLDYLDAHPVAAAMISDLLRAEAASDGRLKTVLSAADLADGLHNQTFGAILHLEGAEPIDPGLDMLHLLYKAGLRSLGIVWSRPNRFGTGVPFVYPSSPDIGAGLTDEGKSLVRECNKLGIMIDVSHLNEKGFWDTAKLSDSPIVATHSNAHAICPMSRNLTDRQLDAIAKSNGVAGVTFDVTMVRPDARLNPDTSIGAIVRHVAYMVERIGIDHVAFGSDFDGAVIPHAIQDATGFSRLIPELERAGFNREELQKLTYRNWLRVLGDTWK